MFNGTYQEPNSYFYSNEILYIIVYNRRLLSFSPSGWDNEKKIGILHENFTTVRPEDPFEDFITKPPVRKVCQCKHWRFKDDGATHSAMLITLCFLLWPSLQLVHDKEINAEDEQVFLMKQQVCVSVCCIFNVTIYWHWQSVWKGPMLILKASFQKCHPLIKVDNTFIFMIIFW